MEALSSSSTTAMTTMETSPFDSISTLIELQKEYVAAGNSIPSTVEATANVLHRWPPTTTILVTPQNGQRANTVSQFTKNTVSENGEIPSLLIQQPRIRNMSRIIIPRTTSSGHSFRSAAD